MLFCRIADHDQFVSVSTIFAVLRRITSSAMKNPLVISEATAALQAFRRYFRILLALLQQEEESRRRAPMESIVNLLEPIWIIAALSFFWWFLGRKSVGPLGGSPALFYGTGFFVNYFFIYLSRRMRRSVDSPKRRFPIEQRLDHIIVYVILRTADYVILGILGFGFLYFVFTPNALPHDIVPVVEAFLAIVMLGFGWGVLTMVVSQSYWLWARLFPVIARGLVLVSGVLYVPDFLPPTIRYVLGFNPILHAIALFRHGFYPQYQSVILDKNYLIGCAIFAVAFGLVLERVTRRKERA